MVTELASRADPVLTVAYCFDGAYAFLTGVSLTSLLHNNPGRMVHVYCLVRDVSQQDRERLTRTARRYGATLDYIELASQGLDDLPQAEHLTSSMIYARLLLPRLLPADLERVVYLDSDTLVLGDIGALATMDMGACAVAAVLDVAHAAMGHRIGLPPGAYVNAGVQVMNLPRWREDSLGERCIAALTDGDASRRFSALDQDALNYCLAGDFVPLSEDWNLAQHHRGEVTVMGKVIQSAPVTAQTRILQFLGRVKPHMVWYLGPGLREFERYKAASEWHDAPLLTPTQVADVVDMADKLCILGRSMEAVDLLKNGLMTLAGRLAQEHAG